jgi:hypothetical protein
MSALVVSRKLLATYIDRSNDLRVVVSNLFDCLDSSDAPQLNYYLTYRGFVVLHHAIKIGYAKYSAIGFRTIWCPPRSGQPKAVGDQSSRDSNSQQNNSIVESTTPL